MRPCSRRNAARFSCFSWLSSAIRARVNDRRALDISGTVLPVPAQLECLQRLEVPDPRRAVLPARPRPYPSPPAGRPLAPPCPYWTCISDTRLTTVTVRHGASLPTSEIVSRTGCDCARHRAQFADDPIFVIRHGRNSGRTAEDIQRLPDVGRRRQGTPRSPAPSSSHAPPAPSSASPPGSRCAPRSDGRPTEAPYAAPRLLSPCAARSRAAPQASVMSLKTTISATGSPAPSRADLM